MERFLVCGEHVHAEVFLATADTYIEQQGDDPIIGYDIEGNPIFASVAKREFKARLDAVDRGDYITLEDLKKESETWLKGTE